MQLFYHVHLSTVIMINVMGAPDSFMEHIMYSQSCLYISINDG